MILKLRSRTLIEIEPTDTKKFEINFSLRGIRLEGKTTKKKLVELRDMIDNALQEAEEDSQPSYSGVQNSQA